MAGAGDDGEPYKSYPLCDKKVHGRAQAFRVAESRNATGAIPDTCHDTHGCRGKRPDKNTCYHDGTDSVMSCAWTPFEARGSWHVVCDCRETMICQ